MAKRLCLKCGVIITQGTRCKKHQAEHKKYKNKLAYRAHRKKYGYGGDWQKTRNKVLKLRGKICELCGDFGDEVDHILPMRLGGSKHNLSNLQVLCRNCHKKKTEIDRKTQPEDLI